MDVSELTMSFLQQKSPPVQDWEARIRVHLPLHSFQRCDRFSGQFVRIIEQRWLESRLESWLGNRSNPVPFLQAFHNFSGVLLEKHHEFAYKNSRYVASGLCLIRFFL
jgi:hypothetical protein